MKKLAMIAAAAALLAVGSSAHATIILSGSTSSVTGNSPNTGNDITIGYTVDLTGGLYTYTYMLSTSPAEKLTSFTIGSLSDPLFTSTAMVTTGTGSVIPGYAVVFYFTGQTSATVAFTSDYGPGESAWGINDLSVTWNNPPLIPAPVPEASTVMAGALMLLPLGIGAIRAVRKERVA